jgi:hypothetical protein
MKFERLSIFAVSARIALSLLSLPMLNARAATTDASASGAALTAKLGARQKMPSLASWKRTGTTRRETGRTIRRISKTPNRKRPFKNHRTRLRSRLDALRVLNRSRGQVDGCLSRAGDRRVSVRRDGMIAHAIVEKFSNKKSL